MCACHPSALIISPWETPQSLLEFSFWWIPLQELQTPSNTVYRIRSCTSSFILSLWRMIWNSDFFHSLRPIIHILTIRWSKNRLGSFKNLELKKKRITLWWKCFVPPNKIQSFLKCFVPPIFKGFLKCFVPPKLMYGNVSYPVPGTQKMFHTPVKNTPAGYAG